MISGRRFLCYEMTALGDYFCCACRLPIVACFAWLSFAVDGLGQGQSAVSPQSGLPSGQSAFAARFDNTDIKATAEPGADVVDFCYHFTNTGDIPLVVQEFVQSCGCMKGEWDGIPVQPGAKGKINAKLLTKGLRGKVRKSLHVKFIASGAVDLTGEVEIPEALSYSERTLHWTVSESPQPKQVDIIIQSKTPLRVLSVSNNDPTFSCEFKTVEEGQHYQIVITPRETKTARVCVMQVRTDSKDPRDAMQGLFAIVENAKTEGAQP